MRWLAILALLAGCAEERDPILVGAGWSDAACPSLCYAWMARDGDSLWVALRSAEDPAIADQLVDRADLTDDGIAELALLGGDLADFELETSYGCPDCEGAVASWIDVDRDGVVVRTTYEADAPPPALEEADAYLRDLMLAIAVCMGDPRFVPRQCTQP